MRWCLDSVKWIEMGLWLNFRWYKRDESLDIWYSFRLNASDCVLALPSDTIHLKNEFGSFYSSIFNSCSSARRPGQIQIFVFFFLLESNLISSISNSGIIFPICVLCQEAAITFLILTRSLDCLIFFYVTKIQHQLKIFEPVCDAYAQYCFKLHNSYAFTAQCTYGQVVHWKPHKCAISTY